MSAHPSDQSPDLHEIFGMDFEQEQERPVVVALPEREPARVEAEVVTDSAGVPGGDHAASAELAGPPETGAGGPPGHYLALTARKLLALPH